MATEAADYLYVDEEGMLHHPLPPAFRTTLFLDQPLFGRALVVGAPGPEGEETPATLSLETVRESVFWLEMPENHTL